MKQKSFQRQRQVIKGKSNREKKERGYILTDIEKKFALSEAYEFLYSVKS